MKYKSLNNFLEKHIFIPKLSHWIFIFFLLVFSLIYNYQSILFYAPQSLHQWRQTDCLSITLNYFQDGNSFLQPATHNLGNDGTGKTVSDFPLIYYSVAQLWKIFGYHEYIYRLLNLIIFFCGLFALFRLIENLLKNSFIAIFISLLFFTSPVIVFYANNFLMNTTALSFAIFGLYFFVKFSSENKTKYLVLMTLFYSIAGLLKITSLLSFAAIGAIFILELINVKFINDKRIFQSPKTQIVAFLIIIIVQLLWYNYAKSYNSTYNQGVFLVGILPFWYLDNETIYQTLLAFHEHIKWDYFRQESQIVFVLLFLSLFIFRKKANRLYMSITFLMSIGFFLILILFFKAIKDHDYYVLDSLLLIPIILSGFFILLKDNFQKLYASLLLKIILIAFLIHNLDFARRRMANRYSNDGWQNENYYKYTKTFTEISPYLRSMGITKEDKVISLSDNSINITLYLMNQKGWTNYNLFNDSSLINKSIKMGAKYIMVYDKSIYENKLLTPYFSNKVGQYKEVSIYKL